MQTIKYKDLTWIDILNPQERDLKFLEENFKFHPLIINEIKTPTYHPVLESYEGYLFWILHFPSLDAVTKQVLSIEIDFFVTKKYLVTIRYHDFNDFDQIFETTKNHLEKYLAKTSGHLFYHIVKFLFGNTFPELDRIKENIDIVEEQIFKDLNEEVIGYLSIVKREIINFIRAIKPQKTVWDISSERAQEFWGERMKPYFSDLYADYSRILSIIETYRDTVDALHLASSSLLDNKRNYVIKILTIFTAILLPLTLFTSIYGMNLSYLPLANHPLTFWFFAALMTAVIVSMLLYFRKRKWL